MPLDPDRPQDSVRPAPAPAGVFPRVRPRRNRSADWVRRMVAEHRVTADDLVWPVFVQEGEGRRDPIPSLPGVHRMSVDLLPEAVAEAASLGIRAVAVFPATPPERKTEDGRESHDPGNLACRSIRAIKAAAPHVGVFTDIALDPYTTHGHDGILRDGRILNDETLEVLCRQAVTVAAAGVDVVAPSDMMDGRIGAIRDALDAAGFADVGICAYAAKYASSFYGPFRDAIGSKGALKGDKKTYQMDPANAEEALREVDLDVAEGADMVMVKPGLPYLDVIRRVKDRFRMPTLAYHVSGEYAMLKAAAMQGWLDNDAALLETMLAFKRAGCDAVYTYAAVEAARLLKAG
jgi:porphobilinogen synthase